MTSKKILHIVNADKFIEPFCDFCEENIKDFCTNHVIYVTGDSRRHVKKVHRNMISCESGALNALLFTVRLIKSLYSSEKIILHGLFNHLIIKLLSLLPINGKRHYWVIMGGDLYAYHNRRNWKWWRHEIFRIILIKKINNFITHIRGDYELAQKWYGAKGVWHECFMYPSNLYQEPPLQNSPHEGINILLGNSANPSNNHIDTLEKLRPYANVDIQIYCPLSYGDQEYAKKIVGYGKSIFGHKFIPLLEFMKFDDYKKLLEKIDIAIFNHDRQQGMGNTNTLLGMGKKVYIKSNVTPAMFFKGIDVTVYKTEDLNIDLIPPDVATKNKIAMSQYFSTANLIDKWTLIFNERKSK